MISDEEIKKALFSMGGLKAPGLDRLHAIFFQSQWDIMGASMCKMTKDIFLDPKKSKQVNKTFVSLILKVDLPKHIM